MKWSESGLMVPTCIFEAATLKHSVIPVCSCGHSASFNPFGLWWHFQRRGWDDRLGPARQRFWCRVCHSSHRRKVHPVKLDLGRLAETDFALPWPDEREWKRAVARVR
ncbi:hypothetical protein HGI47_18515 [Novosphingobium sp. ERN07]|uniref:hypothetical protein n=1 Tax=Novosphingobium sp. ERN07 TaxID=2726187 RepID=UPI001457698D|nr:hypothetical protein [Novosphingobium sp. ERN07]NLR72873.1 hypothetical protein [Novosphingobium sp. ERN07]